jgi:signal transduction histidine kinase/ActR/RegA family two-component response regulator
MTAFGPAYVMSPLLSAGVTIILIVLVSLGAQREASRWAFLLVLASLELWCLFTFVMRSSPSAEAALLWSRAVGFSGLFLFVAFFHFCHLYIGYRSRWPWVLVYCLFVPMALLVLLTDLAIIRVKVAGYGYAPDVGPAGTVIFGAMQLLIGANFVRLLLARRREEVEDKKRRYAWLAVAELLPLIGAALDGFTDLPPMAIWTNLAFCTVCALTIIRYRLFDLHVMARKGLIRLLVSTLIATPYVGAIILASSFFRGRGGQLWIYAAAMIAYALIMLPVYEWARRRIDRLFFSERYDYLEALRNLVASSEGPSSSQTLGSRLAEMIRRALQASAVYLLQPAGDSLDFQRIATSGAADCSPEPVLGSASPALLWLKTRRRSLPARSLNVDPLLQNLPQAERAALDRLQAELLVPLLTPRGNLAGAIVLGPKSSRQSYSTEDVQLLESLGAEAAMALENSLLYREALRTREIWQEWLNSLPDAVVIVDKDGIIRFLNRKGTQSFAQRIGQRVFFSERTLGPGDVPRCFAETIQGREYEIAAAPLVDPEANMSTAFVMRDITERRQEQLRREQLETRARLSSHLASIGEMASGIAHEINNPLTAVLGYSELLGLRALPDSAGQIVAQIVSGAKRVAGIVQRLLTFARQKKPERSAVDLNELIRSTLDLRSYALKTSNIDVRLELDPALPATVADGQQLQQVLLNLIINAETAMRTAQGRGELVLSSGIQGNCIRFSVRDNGPGIPLELQERIFDPFFTTREVGQGTGLGLSICHGILSEHNGRIWVKSSPGQGAEFHVELPILTGETPGPRPEKMHRQAPPTRVLVVDDEVAIRELLKTAIESEGHTVDTAPDGRSGLNCIAAHRYGLILLDVRMPGMSGIEVYEEARKIAGSIATRTVLITGDLMDAETKARIERIGLPAISKPFELKDILHTLGRILSRGL